MTNSIRCAARIIFVLFAGCHSMNNLGYQDAATEDSGSDSVCRADLKPAGCPANWAAAESEPDCQIPTGFTTLGHAGSFLARASGGGYGGDGCIYSPDGDRQLVGVQVSSDVNQFCNWSSFTEVWGTLADGPYVNDLGRPPACPNDAGTGAD